MQISNKSGRRAFLKEPIHFSCKVEKEDYEYLFNLGHENVSKGVRNLIQKIKNLEEKKFDLLKAISHNRVG
jgi:hypothetical protein